MHCDLGLKRMRYLGQHLLNKQRGTLSWVTWPAWLQFEAIGLTWLHQNVHGGRQRAYREGVEVGEDGGVVPGDDPLGLVDGGEVLHPGPELLGDPRDDGVPGGANKQTNSPMSQQ